MKYETVYTGKNVDDVLVWLKHVMEGCRTECNQTLLQFGVRPPYKEMFDEVVEATKANKSEEDGAAYFKKGAFKFKHEFGKDEEPKGYEKKKVRAWLDGLMFYLYIPKPETRVKKGAKKEPALLKTRLRACLLRKTDELYFSWDTYEEKLEELNKTDYRNDTDRFMRALNHLKEEFKLFETEEVNE